MVQRTIPQPLFKYLPLDRAKQVLSERTIRFITSTGIRCTKIGMREPSRFIGRTTRNSIVTHPCYTVGQAQLTDRA